MKQILRAALLLAEIIASVWAIDLAFSLINDPSTILLIGGIWLLFLVGAFWYYRLQVAKRRRQDKKDGGTDVDRADEVSTFGKVEHFVGGLGGDLERRLRNAYRTGKRGNQS
jgi:hypothetical protein